MIRRFNLPIGTKVKLRARGITIEGILKGMGADELYVQAQTRLWAVPYSHIIKMEKAEKPSSSPLKSDGPPSNKPKRKTI